MPNWVIERLGHDYFCRVEGVTLFPTGESTAQEMIKILPSIGSLRELAIWPAEYKTNSQTQSAPGGLDESGAKFIIENLPSLRQLSLLGARLSDDAVFALVDMPTLESVQINRHADFGGDDPVTVAYMGDNPIVSVQISRDSHEDQGASVQ